MVARGLVSSACALKRVRGATKRFGEVRGIAVRPSDLVRCVCRQLLYQLFHSVFAARGGQCMRTYDVDTIDMRRYKGYNFTRRNSSANSIRQLQLYMIVATWFGSSVSSQRQVEFCVESRDDLVSSNLAVTSLDVHTLLESTPVCTLTTV